MRALGLWALATLSAHPLHTTLTEIAYRNADRTIQVTVRAFADDFRAALGGQAVGDSAAARYLRQALSVSDAAGRPLRLDWCGVRRTGDLLWLCLRAPAYAGGGAGPHRLRVQARLFFELYADQINIVQATGDAGRASLLFTRGDPPKALP